MLLIPCPFCGDRNEDEFVCGGDAERKRPAEPAQVSDPEWQDYLYNNTNAKGWVRERWWHAKGCGRWVEIHRNNVTHEIRRRNPGGDHGE